MELIIIAAISRNYALGYKNELIYHIPQDMKHFKNVTTGHTVIMGYNTYKSLPNGALPNRRNIVLCYDKIEIDDDVEIYNSLEVALDNCANDDEVYIMGGASLYKYALENVKVDTLLLTEVDDMAENADAFFPIIDNNKWLKWSTTHYDVSEKNKYAFDFVKYINISLYDFARKLDLADDEYISEHSFVITDTSEIVNINVINKSNNPLPDYETICSAGCDLRAFEDNIVVLKPFERRLIHTGLYIELPKGFEAQIRPRSGLALKKGITVLNSPGTIDADYRGEIGVILINLSSEDFVIENGERIAQMVIASYKQAKWKLCEHLSETARGDGGFGHTGKK